MRTMSLKSLLYLAPLLLIGSDAHANSVLETKVPFPFMVQNHAMPAGQYRIERDTLHPSLLVIRGERGVHATFVTLTRDAPGKDPAGNKATLVFTRHEKTYQLTDVWENSTVGEEIPQK